jgi:hypothetical protein
VKAERVLLSGSARYRGNGADVDVYAFGPDAATVVSEVKARGNGEGFMRLDRWLGDSDILFLRRDRAEPLIVLPWRVWARVILSSRPSGSQPQEKRYPRAAEVLPPTRGARGSAPVLTPYQNSNLPCHRISVVLGSMLSIVFLSALSCPR